MTRYDMIDFRVIEPASLAEFISGGVPGEFTFAPFENRLHSAPGERA